MNGTKVLKISIAVIISVALIYFIVYIFIYGDKSTSANYKKFGQTVARSDNSSSTLGTDPTEVPLDGILINLRGGKYKYMKADLSLKMNSVSEKKDIEKNISYIRDLVLRYSATKNSDELETEKGKEKFKQELKDIIYDKFGYEVEAVYFRNFVLAD